MTPFLAIGIYTNLHESGSLGWSLKLEMGVAVFFISIDEGIFGV
jgi:hypothetical protein